MFKIIIFTHGDLSKSLKATAELISGPDDLVECYSIPLGCDTGSVLALVSESISQSESFNEGVLVLTDLFLGTPFNLLMTIVNDHRFGHITGVNLPMLLEAIALQKETELTMNQVVSLLVAKGQEAIGDCNVFLHDFIFQKEDLNEKHHDS